MKLDLSIIQKAGEKFDFENRRKSDIFKEYGESSVDRFSEIGVTDNLEWPSFLSQSPEGEFIDLKSDSKGVRTPHMKEFDHFFSEDELDNLKGYSSFTKLEEAAEQKNQGSMEGIKLLEEVSTFDDKVISIPNKMKKSFKTAKQNKQPLRIMRNGISPSKKNNQKSINALKFKKSLDSLKKRAIKFTKNNFVSVAHSKKTSCIDINKIKCKISNLRKKRTGTSIRSREKSIKGKSNHNSRVLPNFAFASNSNKSIFRSSRQRSPYKSPGLDKTKKRK